MSDYGGDALGAAETIKAIVYCGRGFVSKKNAVCAAKVVFGVDNDRRKTIVVNDNNPVWNEEGEFKVSKADKASLKFKLYDGDEMTGVIKIPISELTDEKQVKAMTLEPYKKGHEAPEGELQVAAYIVSFKTNTKRRSSTLGHKIKSKLSASNLNVANDDTSVVSGDSRASSKSKISTIRRKVLSKKSKDQMGGAQSMMNLGTSDVRLRKGSLSLNPFMDDMDDEVKAVGSDSGNKGSNLSKFQTLPPQHCHKPAANDVPDQVSCTGSEQSSIPGSAASLERSMKKLEAANNKRGKSIVNIFTKSKDKNKSKSMWDISNLPVESWNQKMEHRLNSSGANEAEAIEDQGISISMDDNGSENSSNNPMNKYLSNPSLVDSAVDMRGPLSSSPSNAGASVGAAYRKNQQSTIESSAESDNSGGKKSATQSRRSSAAHSRNSSMSHQMTVQQQLPAMMITDLIPNKGSNNGGTKLSIIGANFAANKSDFKSVKICGCDVTKTLNIINHSKFTVVTSMWRSTSGNVEIELVDGRKVVSKQTYEFLSTSKLAEEAKNLRVPSFNSASTDKENNKTNKNRSMNNISNSSSLLDTRRKISYSTIGLDNVGLDTPDSSPLTPEEKKAPVLPSNISGNHSMDRNANKNSLELPLAQKGTGSRDTLFSSRDNLTGSKSSLLRKTSDRYKQENGTSFQTRKEMEEEISRLRDLVQDLSNKNLEMNQYLEELLIKVMEHCPDLLQK